MTLHDDVLEALRGVDPSAPSTTALKPLARVLGDALGFADSTYAISVSSPGNLVKQADQSLRAQKAKLLVVCLRNDKFVDAVERTIPKRVGPGRLEAVLVLILGRRPRLAALLEPTGGEVKPRLDRQWPGVPWRAIPALWEGSRTGDVPAVVPLPGVRPRDSTDPPLILDPAIRRMLRLAIASYKAVLLVGPPGTGKTTLLEEAVREAAANPAAYGLSSAPRGLRMTTPEESWTARELVGGETVDDKGRLRFTPGHVLRAIEADRWLVLDEANRADLDRIFGSLLTWLSGKPVVAGVAAGSTDAAEIRLEWATAAASTTEGLERLESGTGAAIRYMAGTDWRLLGTYNAVDAQRVFRLGHALGRRFTRVPVPPIDDKQFLEALQPRLEELPEGFDTGPLEDALAGLYALHRDQYPPLGPATFLAIPAYIARGLLASTTSDDVEDLHPVINAEEVVVSANGPASRAASAPQTAQAHDLLTEAYLLGAGTALAGLDDAEIEIVRERVVDNDGLLNATQWAFIARLLPALS